VLFRSGLGWFKAAFEDQMSLTQVR
jgi:hypothetical protein